MNEAQTKALRDLCERYNVPFNPEHYRPDFSLPSDWVAGWVGGFAVQSEHPTIYVGCDPEGRISS